MFLLGYLEARTDSTDLAVLEQGMVPRAKRAGHGDELLPQVVSGQGQFEHGELGCNEVGGKVADIP